MSLVTARENVVSVLPIIGGINNSQAVFSPRKGNDLTIVRSADLLLRINFKSPLLWGTVSERLFCHPEFISGSRN
jgi:hypothetical protein